MIPLCWHPGCDEELVVVDGRWVCPEGHRLRDISPWLDDHITYMTDSTQTRRHFYGDRR